MDRSRTSAVGSASEPHNERIDQSDGDTEQHTSKKGNQPFIHHPPMEHRSSRDDDDNKRFSYLREALHFLINE
jgi:hypothetical protein